MLPKTDPDAKDISLPDFNINLVPIDPVWQLTNAQPGVDWDRNFLRKLFARRTQIADMLFQQQLDFYLERVSADQLPLYPRLADFFTGRVLGERDDRYNFTFYADKELRYWTSEQISYMLIELAARSLRARAEGNADLEQQYFELFKKIYLVNQDMVLNKTPRVLTVEETEYEGERKEDRPLPDVYQPTAWNGTPAAAEEPYIVPGDTYLKVAHMAGWRMFLAPLDLSHPNILTAISLHSWGMAKSVDGNPRGDASIDSVMPAFDAELRRAFALMTMGAAFKDDEMLNEGVRIANDVRQTGVEKWGSTWFLFANPEFFRQSRTVNMSYVSPAYCKVFAHFDNRHAEQWLGLADSYYKLLRLSGPIPSDWNSLRIDGKLNALGEETSELTLTWGPDHFRQPQDSAATVREAQRIWAAVAEDYYSDASGKKRVTDFFSSYDCPSGLRANSQAYADDPNPKCVIADWAHGTYPSGNKEAPKDGTIPAKLSGNGDEIATWIDVEREHWLKAPSLPASLHWALIPELAGDPETLRLLMTAVENDPVQTGWLSPNYRPLSDPNSEWPDDYYPRIIALLAADSGAGGSIAYLHQFWQLALPQIPEIDSPPTGVQNIQFGTPSYEDRVRAGFYAPLFTEQVSHSWRNAARAVDHQDLSVSLYVVPGEQLLRGYQMQLPFGLRQLGQAEYLPPTSAGFSVVGWSRTDGGDVDNVIELANFNTAKEAVAFARRLQPLLHDYKTFFVRTAAQGMSGWYLKDGVVRRNPEFMPLGHEDLGGTYVPPSANWLMPENLVIYVAPEDGAKIRDLMYGDLIRSSGLAKFCGLESLPALRVELHTILVGKNVSEYKDTADLWQAIYEGGKNNPRQFPILATLVDNPEFRYFVRDRIGNHHDARSALAMDVISHIYALGLPNNEEIEDSLWRGATYGKALTWAKPLLRRHHNDVAQHASAAWIAAVRGDYRTAEQQMNDALSRTQGWADSAAKDRHDQYYETVELQAAMYALMGSDLGRSKADGTQTEAMTKALSIYRTLLNPHEGARVSGNFVVDHYHGTLNGSDIPRILHSAGYIHADGTLTEAGVELATGSRSAVVSGVDNVDLSPLQQLLAKARALRGLPNNEIRQRAAILLKLAELQTQDAMMRQVSGDVALIDNDFAVARELNENPGNFGGGDPYVRIKAWLGSIELALQKVYIEYGALTAVYDQDQAAEVTPHSLDELLDDLTNGIAAINRELLPVLRETENTFRQAGIVDSLREAEHAAITELDVDDAMGSLASDPERQAAVQSLHLYKMQAYSLRGALRLNEYRLKRNHKRLPDPRPGDFLPVELQEALEDFRTARHFSDWVRKSGISFFGDYHNASAWADTAMQLAQGEVAAQHFFHQSTADDRPRHDHQRFAYIHPRPEQEREWRQYFEVHNDAVNNLQAVYELRDMLSPIQRAQLEIIMAQQYLDHAEWVFRDEAANPWKALDEARRHWSLAKRCFEPMGVDGHRTSLLVPPYIQKQLRDLDQAISSFDYRIFVSDTMTEDARADYTRELEP